MGLSLEQMHQRYKQQAGWTADLRTHLFTRGGPGQAKRVLEVGSGTGAVLNGLETVGKIHGVDIHLPSLQFSQRENEGRHLTAGDGRRLPYPTNSFDLTYSHFLLLWVEGAEGAVREMARVTRPGGAVLALAEPDYGGRVDYPEALEPLGDWQREALQAQGAEPEMGRRLAGLFRGAGLAEVEAGVMGAEWRMGAEEDGELEQEVLRADLEGRVAEERVEALLKLEREARARGERVLYVPTFYAWGRVAG